MVEVLKLYELEGKRRAFDSTDGVEVTAGVVEFVPEGFEQPRTYVFVDREDPLGDSYAMKHGGCIEELADDAKIIEIICKGLDGMPGRSNPRYITKDTDLSSWLE